MNAPHHAPPPTTRADITLGFGPHYLEAIPPLVAHMQAHKTIVLEEPPTPGFRKMLRGRMAVDEYLLQLDPGFPLFAKSMCLELRKLFAQGKRIVQVEPYLEGLVQIHDFFADGKRPADILALDGLRDIYLAEKEATGALISFYSLSRTGDFRTVTDAVKTFARLDADRIRLRDRLRARAIIALTVSERNIFVEAGYIHYGLFRFLHPLVSASIRVRPVFLLQPVMQTLRAKRRNFGPGDVLTLLYVLHGSVAADQGDLLAAQSLIAIQLITKDELLPENGYPHCEDDALVNTLISSLGYEQCRRLYRQIRGVPKATALRYTRQHLEKARA
jgi:hypothetical protein